MIEKMSIRLTDQIINNRLISDNMRECYIYAFLKIFETAISVATMIVIGVATKKIIPMLLFWTFFDLLRRRAGGFHCEKYWQCYIATTITFVGVVLVEPIFSTHAVWLYTLLAVAALEIMIIGTINHPNMEYNCEELLRSKELSRRILAIEMVVIVSFFMLDVKVAYLTYMSMGIIFCAILMTLAKILRQEVEVYEERE